MTAGGGREWRQQELPRAAGDPARAGRQAIGPGGAGALLLVTLGDPAGIGPEVVVKALLHEQVRRLRPVVVGHLPTLRETAERLSREGSLGSPPPELAEFPRDARARLPDMAARDAEPPDRAVHVLEPDVEAGPEPVPPGRPGAHTGQMALAAVKLAASLALERTGVALVTAPLSKLWVHRAGTPFRGHTEYLAAASGCRSVLMTMIGGGLRVGVLTTHLPLRSVPAAVTTHRLQRALRLVHASRYLFEGTGTPRVAVCGLNPHAGEGGLVGREEELVIAPAIAWARAKGMAAEGPVSADTVFRRALAGEFDFVLSLYHDQGLIPVKLLATDGGVNVTLGLPFVRTSVDHGTAFDIAGKGLARETSLVSAILLAQHLVARRGTG